LAPISSNPDFVDVIEACIQTIRDDPTGVSEHRHRLGLVASGPVAQLTDLSTLVQFGRSADSVAAYSAVVEGGTGDQIRSRHEQLHKTVAKALERLDGAAPDAATADFVTWQVAASLEVWIANVEVGGAESLAAINRLADTITDRTKAIEVFAAIKELAEELAPHAGTLDLGILRWELDRRGVALGPSYVEQTAWNRIQVASDRLLRATPDAIGGTLRLPRSLTRTEIIAASQTESFVLVSGKAGAGKSVLARAAASELQTGGAAVVVLGISPGMTAADLNAELGTNLVEAMRAAPTGLTRVLVVDGAEQALVDGGRLLSFLIGCLPAEGTAPAWNLLLVARDEAADAIAALAEVQLGRRPVTIRVDDLSDEEVDEILAAFPELQGLARHPRPSRLLLRRPYLVNVLVRSGPGATLEGLLGEEDVLDLVVDRLVRRGGGAPAGRGTPADRSIAYLALADALVAGRPLDRLIGTNGEAIEGLLSDDVIVRERSVYRFAHDVLADYALAWRLLEPDGAEALFGSPEPRRLLRAVRLVMQHRLAKAANNGTVVAAYEDIQRLAQQLVVADGTRWEWLTLEALLQAGPAPRLLESLQDRLLLSEGTLLKSLLEIADRSARPYRETGSDTWDLTITAPVVDLLARMGSSVPDRLIALVCKFVRSHLKQLGPEPISNPAARVDGPALLAAAVGWGPRHALFGRHPNALAVLMLLASQLTDAAEAALMELARSDSAEIGDAIEDPDVLALVAPNRPDLVLRLAGLYYLDLELFSDPEDDVPLETRRARGRMTSYFDEGEEDGVRDHETRPGGSIFPTANRGPFASLLAVDGALGRRLVGEVVDAATRARRRLEAGHGWPLYEVSIDLPDGSSRSFEGTDHVWLWYRASGVGSYPAMSALMALREWALGEVASRGLTSVIEEVLTTGKSLAFVAVAWSVLLEHLEESRSLVGAFLSHPLIWHLEVSRVGQEGHGLSPRVGPESPLLWQPSHVAARLALTADVEEQERLRVIGRALIDHHYESVIGTNPDSPRTNDLEIALAQTRRWASELDAEQYAMTPHGPGAIAFSVQIPEDVRATLEDSGGRVAGQWLEMSNLAFEAMRLRDQPEENLLAEDTVVTRWRRANELLLEIDGLDGPLTPVDALAATATCVLQRANSGFDVSTFDLQSAAEGLVAGAIEMMPSEYADRTQSWGLGHDRSMAVAIPILLGPLRLRTSLTSEHVREALFHLAASPAAEVRTRLVAGLRDAWHQSTCGEEAHDDVFEVIQEMIACSGYGPLQGYGRPRTRLAFPLEQSLNTTELILDVGGAGDVMPLLIEISKQECPHGIRSRDLVATLLSYDRSVWPVQFARHHFSELGGWRRELDQLVAERALDGDASGLWDHLNAFAETPEESRGVIELLASRANTSERVTALHELWPTILDRLLPVGRAGSGSGERRAWHGDFEELDRLLLPSPAEDTLWPPESTAQITRRWVTAFTSAPHVVDRLITVTALFGWLPSPTCTEWVLSVLGEDFDSIRRESGVVVQWLRFVLVDHPEAASSPRAVRAVLDGLVDAGRGDALVLQHQLEA
jgi:hypothetical protein